MNTVQEKAMHFLTALADVYRDEDSRELEAFSKMEISDDFTEDVTAMLLAMKVFVDRITRDDGDIIDFTYTLNKLAVQYVMEKEDRQCLTE